MAFVYLFICNSGKNKENTSKGVCVSCDSACHFVKLRKLGRVINEFFVSRFLFHLPFFSSKGMVSPWPICDLIGPSSTLGTEVGLNKARLTGLRTSCSTDVVLGLDWAAYKRPKSETFEAFLFLLIRLLIPVLEESRRLNKSIKSISSLDSQLGLPPSLISKSGSASTSSTNSP